MSTDALPVTVSGGVGPKRRRGSQTERYTRGLFWNRETYRVLTGTKVRTRLRLDTKQEPNYTLTTKTQVDTIRLMRTETTQRDTGEDNDRQGNTRAGQNKTRGARLWP